MKLRAGGVKKTSARLFPYEVTPHAAQHLEMRADTCRRSVCLQVCWLCVRSVHGRPVSPLHTCAHFEWWSHDTQGDGRYVT